MKLLNTNKSWLISPLMWFGGAIILLIFDYFELYGHWWLIICLIMIIPMGILRGDLDKSIKQK